MAIGPISPKAHGAWLGSGSGAALANEVINLIQTYVTHAPLPQPTVALIYTLVPALMAFIGAYVVPAIPSSLSQQAQNVANGAPPALPLMLPPLPQLKEPAA
jgi:hypothetical protein